LNYSPARLHSIEKDQPSEKNQGIVQKGEWLLHRQKTKGQVDVTEVVQDSNFIIFRHINGFKFIFSGKKKVMECIHYSFSSILELLRRGWPVVFSIYK
jgi:hypothetical protein